MTCKTCGERSCFCGLRTYGTGPAKGLTGYGDRQPKIARIIERGPWTHYAKCWECGAEASHCCVGDDGKEALEVCDDRELVIDDSHARCRPEKGQTRRDAPPDRRPQAVSRRARGVLEDPQYAPCQCCGARTRLWGRAVAEGRTWCGAATCLRHRSRMRSEARRAAAGVPPSVPTVCHWCGVDVGSRRQTTRWPCCGDRSCKRAAAREWARINRSQTSPDPASQRHETPAHA